MHAVVKPNQEIHQHILFLLVLGISTEVRRLPVLHREPHQRRRESEAGADISALQPNHWETRADPGEEGQRQWRRWGQVRYGSVPVLWNKPRRRTCNIWLSLYSAFEHIRQNDCKEIVQPKMKFCYHLLTLMSFQICMTLFLLNTNGEVIRIALVTLFHALAITEALNKDTKKHRGLINVVF